MSMTTLQYEYKDAKRPHKHRCEMTGIPVDKGDKYFQGAWVTSDGKHSIKALAVIQSMADESMKRQRETEWDPGYADEYLFEFLSHAGLSEEEVKRCHDHALSLWWRKAPRLKCSPNVEPISVGESVLHPEHGSGLVLEVKWVHCPDEDSYLLPDAPGYWSVKWQDSWGAVRFDPSYRLCKGF